VLQDHADAGAGAGQLAGADAAVAVFVPPTRLPSTRITPKAGSSPSEELSSSFLKASEDMSLKLDRRDVGGRMLAYGRDVRMGHSQGRCECAEARRLVRGGRFRVP
jgi:hypothetical protein